MSFSALNYAKSKLLEGDFQMASNYYNRAIEDGVPACVVNLRYLTKEYLVYPLEYEQSSRYFALIRSVHELASQNSDYIDEYKMAAKSLVDIRRLFLRSLSLFYFSDILVSSSNSVVLKEIAEIQRYIKVNKEQILEDDVYELNKYIPKYNKKSFARDLNIIEAYCMNILLSYTAEQHSVYAGKRYNATTIDYGYFYSTTVRESNKYYNFANIKPRMFLLGYQTYYYDLLEVYKKKLKEIGSFNSPEELKKELTYYVRHKDKKDKSSKEFLKYAKHFEKQDDSRDSWFGIIMKINTFLNPLLKLNPFKGILSQNVGSFELNEPFTQKKFLGVCSMLAAGQGWKIDTVRYCMLFACGLLVGFFVYFGLAIAKKLGYYFGVNVERP